MAQATKTFGGKKYGFTDFASTKAKAGKLAKGSRSRGFNARVTSPGKNSKQYVVWTRKRGR